MAGERTVTGSNGERGFRLLAAEGGIDSEVWLGSVVFRAIAAGSIEVAGDEDSAARARTLAIELQDSFLDGEPRELFGSDLELLEAGLVAELERKKPKTRSELQIKAYNAFQKASRQLLAEIRKRKSPIIELGVEFGLTWRDVDEARQEVIDNLLEYEGLLSDDEERVRKVAQRRVAEFKADAEYYESRDTDEILQKASYIFDTVEQLQKMGLSVREIAEYMQQNHPYMTHLASLLEKTSWGRKLWQAVTAAAVRSEESQEDTNPAA